jgi:hypothetical protein
MESASFHHLEPLGGSGSFEAPTPQHVAGMPRPVAVIPLGVASPDRHGYGYGYPPSPVAAQASRPSTLSVPAVAGGVVPLGGPPPRRRGFGGPVVSI